MKSRDLFEELKNAVGCEYISDLQLGISNYRARSILKSMQIDSYPLYALSDAAQYIFHINKEFKSYEEAAEFLRNAK